MRRLPGTAVIPFLLALVLLLAGCGGAATAGSSNPTGSTGTASPAGSTGTASPAGPLRVVALGDSVVAGTGCDCKAFPQRYAALVTAATGRPVRWSDDGVNGLTSAGLLTDLRTGRQADDVGTADVVLVTIGANDFSAALAAYSGAGCSQSCSTAQLPRLGRDIAAIVARITALRDGAPVRIAVTDYWNVFEDGQVARHDYGSGFSAWSDRLTRQVNAAICRAATPAGATCVDLYVPFEFDPGSGQRRDPTSLLADDGDHPDAAGHALIARTIAADVLP